MKNSSTQFALAQLKTLVPKINDRMQAHLDDAIKQTNDLHGEQAAAYMKEVRRVALAGGKRIRGALVYYGYLLGGGGDEESILDVAAAIELIHTYILIEDDFMDKATARRGYPTLNATVAQMYQKYLSEENGSVNNFSAFLTESFNSDSELKNTDRLPQGDIMHFANSLAVTLSLILSHIALDIFTTADFKDSLKINALHYLHRQIQIVGHGQMFDILNEVNTHVTKEDILNVHKWKTASYTIENPLLIGAILSGMKSRDLETLRAFSIPLGVAFQIQDDIMGTFGDSEKSGKSVDSDIRDGKKTLLTWHIEEYGTTKEKTLLHSVLGNRNATDKEIDALRNLMKSSGALQYSIDEVKRLTEQALQILEKGKNPNWNTDSLNFLTGIAGYMVERKV